MHARYQRASRVSYDSHGGALCTAGRRIGLQKLRACGGPKTAAEDENDSPTSVLDQAEGQQQQQAAAAPARPTRWQLVGNLGKGDASVLLSSSARGIRQGLVSGGL